MLIYNCVQTMVIGLDMGYNPVMFFVKLSLFLLYLHFFSLSNIRIFVHLGIVSILVVYTGITIGWGVMCIPKRGEGWVDILSDQKCVVSSKKMNYIVGSFGVISDFYILSLPIPVILRSNLSRMQKIKVCAVFMTGFL